jgi:hypothetical protein
MQSSSLGDFEVLERRASTPRKIEIRERLTTSSVDGSSSVGDFSMAGRPAGPGNRTDEQDRPDRHH